MSFEIGQTVVYPHHGAAKIEEISTRVIRGEEKTYLTLRVSQGDLTIQVPAENVDLVGVRDVVDEDGLETVLSVLRAPYIEEPTNWSRRFKANQEKIATGDIVKVAEVVRDLTRRDDQKKLSTGEKRMLTKARQILSSELALARDIDKTAAAARLDEVLAEGYDESLAIADDLPEEDTEQEGPPHPRLRFSRSLLRPDRVRAWAQIARKLWLTSMECLWLSTRLGTFIPVALIVLL